MPNKSCKDCKHDNQQFLCTHPDEPKPGFWEDQREVDGRNWCWTGRPCIECGETVKHHPLCISGHKLNAEGKEESQ